MKRQGNIHVIVVAAGSGLRFGGSLPKQFCDLEGRPVLMWTLERFARALPDAHQVLVLSSSGVDLWRELCDIHGFQSPEIVVGGSTRWESVKNALMSLGQLSSDDIVMVHDGARPLVDKPLIDRLLDVMDSNISALPGVSPVDSLRLIVDDGGSMPLDRSRVRAVQTPQVFRGDALLQAYSLEYSPLFTDDASVMSAAGFPAPAIVDGDPKCLKITLPADLQLAAMYIRDERSQKA